MPVIMQVVKRPLRVDVQELARFLVKAKANTYAGNQREVEPQRPGFKELVFKEGRWEYRDSYAGFYSAPGIETVRFDGQPVWSMSYSGTIAKKYYGNEEFASHTFAFLKEALSRVDIEMPFRGPKFYALERDQTSWMYVCESKSVFDEHVILSGGTEVEPIVGFRGKEFIYCDDQVVFVQDFIGGLIVPKAGLELRT